MDNTGFTDRSNKPLYVGDIVQWRLGKFGKKSAGPGLFKLIRTKKGIKMVNPVGENYEGQLMRKTYSEYVTLVDTSERLK